MAAKHLIDVGAGVIDPDYEGECKVVLFNHNDKPYIVRKGEKCAQVLFEHLEEPAFKQGKVGAASGTLKLEKIERLRLHDQLSSAGRSGDVKDALAVLKQFESTGSEASMAKAVERAEQSAADRAEAMVTASLAFFTPTEKRALIAGMTIVHHFENGGEASSLAPELLERYEILSSGDRNRVNEFEDRPSWQR